MAHRTSVPPLKKTRTELKALQDQQGHINRYKETQTALEATANKTAEYRSELKQLQSLQKNGNTLTETQLNKIKNLEQGIAGSRVLKPPNVTNCKTISKLCKKLDSMSTNYPEV